MIWTLLLQQPIFHQTASSWLLFMSTHLSKIFQ